MLILGGEFIVEPTQRDEFIASRHDAIRRTRVEPGCLEYAICADPVDPGRVVLYERWEDQPSLDAHLQVLQSTPPPPGPAVVPKSVSIRVYDVTGERPLRT